MQICLTGHENVPKDVRRHKQTLAQDNSPERGDHSGVPFNPVDNRYDDDKRTDDLCKCNAGAVYVTMVREHPEHGVSDGPREEQNDADEVQEHLPKDSTRPFKYPE